MIKLGIHATKLASKRALPKPQSPHSGRVGQWPFTSQNYSREAAKWRIDHVDGRRAKKRRALNSPCSALIGSGQKALKGRRRARSSPLPEYRHYMNNNGSIFFASNHDIMLGSKNLQRSFYELNDIFLPMLIVKWSNVSPLFTLSI